MSMTVKELIVILEECNPEAAVKLMGDSFFTDAGTWLEGDEIDIGYIWPAEGRQRAKMIVIER